MWTTTTASINADQLVFHLSENQKTAEWLTFTLGFTSGSEREKSTYNAET